VAKAELVPVQKQSFETARQMIRFEDGRFAQNPAQGMPAVSFLFALKNLP
jgi:hypothetical protein